MRHAQTEWNRDKIIQGQSESILTPEGREAAKGWGRALAGRGYQRIIASDLLRTRNTAALVNETLQLPVEYDSRLREQDWGRWVGSTVRELREKDPAAVAYQEAMGWEFRPPGGENRLELLERSMNALLDAAERYLGERILVVCHGGVLKAVTHHLLAMEFLPEEGNPLMPYHLHRVAAAGGVLTLEKLNEPLT
ncbi:histidine phosphatase family protein [Oceanidesulfovibrio marinus]|uniref:Histidine phosphatase family protein n=2 Tax=Oceanidesulfovibrio marinus TaxID=370038 RepID=A0ABX6NKU6_9BACT|nr:histidine phosphatase family protein [Oceanidesulfovibrio marinus]